MIPSVVIKQDGVENKKYQKMLFQKMQELWITQQMVDLTFQIDDLKVHAHQVVVAACSKHLCDALTQIQSKTQTRNVVMDLSHGGFKMRALKELLNYVYFGQMKLSSKNYFDVRRVATILQITHIVAVCDIFAKSFVQKKNHGSPTDLEVTSTGIVAKIVMDQNTRKPNSEKVNETPISKSSPKSMNVDPKETAKGPEIKNMFNNSDTSDLSQEVSYGSDETRPFSAHVETKPFGKNHGTEHIGCENQGKSLINTDSPNFPEQRSPTDVNFAPSSDIFSQAGNCNVSEVTVEIDGVKHIYEIENNCVENVSESQNSTISETDLAQKARYMPTGSASDFKFNTDNVKTEPFISTEPHNFAPQVIKSPLPGDRDFSEVTVKIEPTENSFETDYRNIKDTSEHLSDSLTFHPDRIVSFPQQHLSPVSIKIEPSDSGFQDNNAQNLQSSENSDKKTDAREECKPNSSCKIVKTELLPQEETKQKSLEMLDDEKAAFVEYTFFEESDQQTPEVVEDERSTIQLPDSPELKFEPDQNVGRFSSKTPVVETFNAPSLNLTTDSVVINEIPHHQHGLINNIQKRKTKSRDKHKQVKRAFKVNEGKDPESTEKTSKKIKVSFQKSPEVDACIDLAYGQFLSGKSVVGSLGTLSHKPQPQTLETFQMGLSDSPLSTDTLIWSRAERASDIVDAGADSKSTPKISETRCEESDNVPTILDKSTENKILRFPSASSSCEGGQNGANAKQSSTDKNVVFLSSLLSTNSQKFFVKCVICHYHCDSVSKCEKHILNIHCSARIFEDSSEKVQTLESKKKDETAMYICSSCKYMTPNQRFILIHRLYHHKIPIDLSVMAPYCKQCMLLLDKDTDLDKHKLTHMEHYCCLLCEKRFLHHKNALDHVKLIHKTVTRNSWRLYIERAYN